MMTSCENDLFLGLRNKTDKTKNTANTVSCSPLLVLHGFGGVRAFKQVLWTALVELHLSSVNWFAFVRHVLDLCFIYRNHLGPLLDLRLPVPTIVG